MTQWTVNFKPEDCPVSASHVMQIAGYPADVEPSPRSNMLLNDAEQWFKETVRPFAILHEVPIQAVEGSRINLTRGTLDSPLLARRVKRFKARAGVAFALTLGPELDEAVNLLWESEDVDVAYFRDAYATVLVKQLQQNLWHGLSAHYSTETILPHYSPGYDGWDLEDQCNLYRAIFPDGAHPVVEVMESGMILPTKSLLGFFTIIEKKTTRAEPN